MDTQRTIAEPSAEARLLYGYLVTIAEGDTLTWDAIKAGCGVDCRTHRSALTTARRWLLNRDGIVYQAVAGVGVRRVGNHGKLAEMDQRKRRISSQARKGLKIARVVAVDAMTQSERLHHAAVASVLAAAEHASSPKTERLISSTIKDDRPLALAQTLDALKGIRE